MFHSAHNPDATIRASLRSGTKVRRSKPAALLLSGLMLIAAIAPTPAASCDAERGEVCYERSAGDKAFEKDLAEVAALLHATKTKPVAVVTEALKPRPSRVEPRE
jgi:hypothetical protein